MRLVATGPQVLCPGGEKLLAAELLLKGVILYRYIVLNSAKALVIDQLAHAICASFHDNESI